MVFWGRRFPPKKRTKTSRLELSSSKGKFLRSFLEEIEDTKYWLAQKPFQNHLTFSLLAGL